MGGVWAISRLSARLLQRSRHYQRTSGMASPADKVDVPGPELVHRNLPSIQVLAKGFCDIHRLCY